MYSVMRADQIDIANFLSDSEADVVIGIVSTQLTDI